MPTKREELERIAKAEGCRIVNNPQVGASFGLNLGLVNADLIYLARGIGQLNCGTNPNPELPNNGFIGGQCATTYVVRVPGTFTRRRCSDNVATGSTTVTGNDNSVTIPGPIVSITRVTTLSGPCGPRNFQWQVLNAAGTTLSTPLQTAGAASTEKLEFFGGPIVTRQDGAPDTCGNRPSTSPPPYVPTETTYNITYQDNSATTINESYRVTVFAPIIGIGGAIYAPISLKGTLNFNGTLQLFPNFKLSIQPELQLNFGLPGDGPSYSPENPTGDPGIEQPGKVIVGALVTATDATGGKATRIAQNDNPDIYAPRLGNLSFYIRTARGGGWTSDVPIKTVRAYIPCPVPGGAVSVKATPDVGYTLEVNPIYDVPLAPDRIGVA